MKVKNLTSKNQGLAVVELVGGKTFNISIQPYGMTEITGPYYILDDGKFKGGILELVGEDKSISKSKTPEIKEEPKATEVDNELPETPAEEVEDEGLETPAEEVEATEESVDAPETVTDKFVCTICDAEFASERGLKSHMNRVHAE